VELDVPFDRLMAWKIRLSWLLPHGPRLIVSAARKSPLAS